MSGFTISVVIPAYNRPVELHRALTSVARQTVMPTEVVVCDDGSTEDLSAVIDEFRGQLPLQYLRIENSGGPALPRNRAVEHASGDWVAWLDSDDWWDPDKIEVVQAQLSDADVVYHRLRTVAPGGGTRLHRRIQGWGTLSADGAAFDLLTLGNPIPMSAAVIKRSLFRSLGGMQHSPSTIEDLEFWLRAAFAGARFRFVRRALGCYQVTPNSRSSIFLEQARYFSEIYARYEPRFETSRRAAVSSYRHYCVAVQYQHAGDIERARMELGQAIGLRTLRQRLSRVLKLILLTWQLK